MSDMAADRYPDWLGGLALESPLLLASFVAALGNGHSPALGVSALLIVVGHLLTLAMIAPLVGHRRRYVLWFFVPFWSISITWTFGTRLTRLSRTGSWQPDELELEAVA